MPSALAAVDASRHRAGRRRPCAEDPADRGRVEPALVEGARRSHADAGDDLVPGDDRRQQLPAVDVVRLARRRRRRHDDRAHVCHRVGVRVVVVEAVAEHRVRECSRGRRQRTVVADHRGLWLPAELGHRRPSLGGDAERARCEAAAKRVEDVELGGLDDGLRDVVVFEGRRESGDALCSSGHGVSPPTVHSVSVPGNVSRTSSASRR